MTNKKKIRSALGDRVVGAFCIVFIVLFSFMVLLPFWTVLMDSFSGAPIKAHSRMWPEDFTLSAYESVLSQKRLLINYGNTIFVTVVGTALTVATTFLAAYPLSKREMPFNRLLTYMVLFTMYFGGGLIPQYIMYKNLGLYDSRLVLILPGMFSAYYILVMRNFIRSIPSELEENALIDGANEIIIACKIYFPLMLPITATVALWSAVGHWNSWFSAMIYIVTPSKQVMQVILRNMLLEAQISQLYDDPTAAVTQTADAIKAVTIIITILPIIMAYPFLQKYFVKGLTAGAVKG